MVLLQTWTTLALVAGAFAAPAKETFDYVSSVALCPRLGIVGVARPPWDASFSNWAHD
jgi:hypothetical protein